MYIKKLILVIYSVLSLKRFAAALAVVVTVAVLTLTAKYDSKNVLPEMKMPYAALNMILRAEIRITNDIDYLEWLEKESGMSRNKIWKLFNYLAKNRTRDEVIENARSEINESLEEFRGLPDNKKTDFFVINLLAPHLTMAVNSFAADSVNEKEIQTVFAQLFNAPQDKKNPVAELTDATDRYSRGKTINVSYKYEMNHYLRSKGFYLDYDLRNSYANIFKIESVICEDKVWKRDEKISILILKRIYPNILSSKLGFAPASHSDVVVVKDIINYIAKEYKSERQMKMPHNPYINESYQEVWKAQNLGIDVVRANRIRYELAQKDLRGSSLSKIEDNLIIQTAIHEAKHRVDEIEMPEMRLNLDLEVSAYLTQAITGVYPFLGLRNTIEWTEAYFHGTKRRKLLYLLTELWTLADKSLKDDYSKELLRAELMKIYTNYKTIQGNANFIDLMEFEQRMVPVILRRDS
ncbi:MAG: hypothetical protein LBI42_11590 [Chitinispirillales bacterium]|jgi:hypothetical protein|nr:hypothetical protein [Chitinispirillales bacterium]